MTQEEREVHLRTEGWIEVPGHLRKHVIPAKFPQAYLKQRGVFLAPQWVVDVVDMLHAVDTTAEHYSGRCLLEWAAQAVYRQKLLPEHDVAALRLGGPVALQALLT